MTTWSPGIPITGSAETSKYYKVSSELYGSWFAAVYDLVTLPLRRLRRRVVRLANIAPGMRVLDAATGTGLQARAFGEIGATVVGIDLATDARDCAPQESKPEHLVRRSRCRRLADGRRNV